MKLRRCFCREADARCAPSCATCGHRYRRHCRRQPQGQSRASCFSPLPAPRPTARISPSKRRRPARWRSPPSSVRTDCRPAVAFVPVTQRAPRAGAGGGEILSAPARHHRRGHRHQRQDLGRRLHAADLGGARISGRQHRHHRRGVADAAKNTARSPRPIRSNCIARSTSWRARASPIWRSKPPRTASTSTGSTACASPPAPSPICRAIISIIIRPSKTISPPSCACSRT